MEKLHCVNCGLELGKGARFCHGCGQTTQSAPAPGQPVDPQVQHQPVAQQQQAQANSVQPVPNPSGFRLPERLQYPTGKRKSEIITTDSADGEPIVKFRNLHPNAVWLFFFQYMGKAAIVLLVMIMAAFVQPLFAIVGFSIYVVIVFFIARINYKNYEFEVSPVAFKKQYGIFHKYSVNISYEQIQNINKRRSVIDRMLGLAHLEIETAGTAGNVTKNVGGLKTIAEGYIPGITSEEADDVMALMLARIQQS